MHLSAPASPSAAHSILEKVHCVRLCSHPHPCPTPLTPCAQTAPTSNLAIHVCVCRSLLARTMVDGRPCSAFTWSEEWRRCAGSSFATQAWSTWQWACDTLCQSNVVPYHPPPERTIPCMGGRRGCIRMCEANSCPALNCENAVITQLWGPLVRV